MSLLDIWSNASCRISLASTAVVLFSVVLASVQGGAFALMHAGAVRGKNALTVLMHTLTGQIVASLLFFAVGFSIAFGPSLGGNGVVGSLEWHFLADPDLPFCYVGAAAVPLSLFVALHTLFASLGVILVSASWAEKMFYLSALGFFVFYPLLVHNFLAHWIWHPQGWIKLGRNWVALDYAGGIVVLTAAGAASWISAAFLKRRPHMAYDMHNMPLMVIGGALVMVQFLALFAGSSGGENVITMSNAVLGGILAAAGGAMAWALLARAVERRWHVSELVSGAISGMAAVSSGVGYSAPYASLVVGVIGASAGFLFRRFLRDVVAFDDVLGTIATYGIPGGVGALCTAFVADRRYGSPVDGLFRDLDAGGSLLIGQVLGVVVAWAWASVMTFIILMALKHTVGLEAHKKSEAAGLDLYEIGERAYAIEENKNDKLTPQQLTAKVIHYAASGQVVELRRLIDAGASPSAVDYDYRTPAHFAAYQGHIDVLELLHEHNVDLDAEDNYGSTPVHAAMSHGHTRTVRWLRDHGAVSGSNAPMGARRPQAAPQSAAQESRDIVDHATDGQNVDTMSEGSDSAYSYTYVTVSGEEH